MMTVRKLGGYSAGVGAVAFGWFYYDPNTKSFNSVFPYVLMGAGAVYWMIRGKPTRYDTMIGVSGLIAGFLVLSGIYGFNQEYGGGRSLLENAFR